MFLYANKIKSKGLVVDIESRNYYQDLLECKTSMINKLTEITLEYYRGIYQAHGNKKILTEAIGDSYTELKSLFEKFSADVMSILDKWIAEIKNHAQSILKGEIVTKFHQLKDSNFDYSIIDFSFEDGEKYYTYNNTYSWFGGNHGFTNMLATSKVAELMTPESLHQDDVQITFEKIFGLTKEAFSADLMNDEITYEMSIAMVESFLKRIESVGDFLDEMRLDVAKGLTSAGAGIEAICNNEDEPDTLNRMRAERFVLISDILLSATGLFMQGVDNSLAEYNRILAGITKMMMYAQANNLQ
jgi:hypothetical protein